MSFVRPDIKIWLYKWRECLISIIITLFGFWLILNGITKYNIILQSLGGIIGVVGLCITFAAYKRVSFYQFPGGLGLIEVKEKQIIYYDPSGGLAFSAENLVSIEIIGSDTSQSTWKLSTEDKSVVNIPLNALGNEKLFDVFLTLPGIDPAELIKAVNNPNKTMQKIWTK